MDVSQASHGLGDPKLLEIIDKLVELNIGDSLLVVGDQSSGKSSVLEGLTGLPFPRDSTLCTRFATQITFRRAATTDINVSIIPDKSTRKDEAERLKSWRRTGIRSLDRRNFSQILAEVHEAMGIGKSPQGIEGSKKSFSDDVLKIEVAGPNQQHLSVVDVPGIFRKITEGVTTPMDMLNVRAMVERYMANSRSIILPVIPANVDIATQEILDMAEKHDGDGQRTLGVLTKPDLVDKGAEHNVLDLMQGTSHKLNLGWCMVKNPGQQDLKREDPFDRHALEQAFFKNETPWCTLDKDRVGVDSLRVRLIELLAEIVRREFNFVRKDVNQSLKISEKKLRALGPCRETREQQQKYLLDLATQFQGMTAQALEAHCASDGSFSSKGNLRLATAVVHRNELFSQEVQLYGHTRSFKSQAAIKEEEGDAQLTSSGSVSTGSNSGDELYSTRHFEDPDDLDDILLNEEIHANPRHGIVGWLKEIYTASRGFELGTFNASLVNIVWREQCSKWDNLALGYTSDIVSLTHNFICTLLKEICEDDRVKKTLLSMMMDKLTERYKRALDQTQFILEVESNPMTYNHYLAQNLEKCREDRTKAQLEDKVFHDDNYGNIFKESDLHQVQNRSNLESTVETLHDILKSYYKVARKRFVDNVCMQAADRHLIRGPDTAVKVFSPFFVTDLTPEQMETIAGEDLLTKRKRADLTREVENLKQAKKLLVVV
ncbi:MAG: hypothetical protein Q9201_006178 [Fulgogasparrea decipioides]